MRDSDLRRLDEIAQAIYDKKGMNILALDVRGITSFTEYYIIAEGNVERHVSSLAKAVINQQKNSHHNPLRVEGEQSGDWVVIDFGHIVIHLFHPDMREKYALEQLWREAKIVDLKFQLNEGNSDE